MERYLPGDNAENYERFGQNYAKSWQDSKRTIYDAGLQP
jgi:hypothetical protein